MKKILKKGKKEGAIIFLHGNSSSSLVFEHILNSNKIQHTKIAVDLPGHGESKLEYNHHKDYSINFYSKKLIEYINSLKNDILLVGNSLGGHLALEIANQVKNLKGLVIFGTPPVKKPLNLEEAFLPIAALQTFFTENPTEQEIINAAEVALANTKDSKVIIDDFKNTIPRVRKCIAEDILDNNLANEHEIYENLDVHKFIIAGDNDPSVNLAYQKRLNKISKKSNLIVFDNCGHYPSLEQPEEFLKTIDAISKKVFI